MIMNVRNTRGDRWMLNWGTHNGIVVATAILEIADIRGGMFDHHMAGFNVRRSTGEKYASAGLIWKSYAEKAIKNVMNEVKIFIDDEEIKEVKQQIDKEVMIPVDMKDNGEGEANSSHIFGFISKFLPSWTEKPDYLAYRLIFRDVETIVCDILWEIIKDAIVQIAARKELQVRCDHIKDGILEIPAQTMPWMEHVVNYNKVHNNEVKFVIFRYPAGGWAAQCVPLSIEERFKQLVPFPKEWAGGNEKTLPEISGIKKATFCHNECSFAKARTKYAIIEMCQIAMNKA